jgi:hypothetical protein
MRVLHNFHRRYDNDETYDHPMPVNFLQAARLGTTGQGRTTRNTATSRAPDRRGRMLTPRDVAVTHCPEA